VPQLTRLRGFQDLIGPSAEALSYVENAFRSIVELHGFREIRIPILERVELYQRSSGETSDIVEKQMYVFADRDEAETIVALRPEGTPGVVRAYIEAGLDRSDPEQRLYYSGPMFRRERPQKGRYRQFYQFGIEVFGRADAACDAEVILIIDELRRKLGLDFRFEINSIGDANCRPQFREAVYNFGKAHYDELCADCKNRLERNPIRLLDCKTDVALMADAPKSADYLCEPCKTHFAQVKDLLKAGGVEYIENPRLVRGLDYYTRTTFEVIASGLGSQSTAVAGGRYDGLIEALGGASTPGIGFGCGLERVALALEAAGKLPSQSIDAVIIAMGEAATLRAVAVARSMRDAGLRVEMFSPERKLKALLGRANKIGARYAIIIGENEIQKGVVVLRDLKASTQREVEEADIAAAIAPVPDH
jgi:histidyl-tRNA synthetase